MSSTGLRALPLLLAILILAGCLPVPITPGTQELVPDAADAATALPTSPAGPLPEVVISDVVVLNGEDADEWNVLGIAHNDSSSTLGSVELRIELVDTAGGVTSEATASLPLSVLQPEAASPFAARLHQSEPPAGARVSLESFQFSSVAPASVRLGTVYTTQAPDGVIVLGTVQARDPRPMRVADVVVAWRDAGRSLAGMAVAESPGPALPQGASLPWIAHAVGASPAARFEVFVSSSVVQALSESPLLMVEGPAWRVTSQGHGFTTGAIRNAGSAPVFPQVGLAAYAAGRPISLEILQSSIPLQPGETLAFAADEFPGLQATLKSAGIDIADVTLETYLDAQPVPHEAAPALLLPVSINQFEAIGSSLFLRGTVSNPDSVRLESAAVFVSVRSTAGEAVSARWLHLNPPPGEGDMEFSADMPLAAGVDAAMCEYDVRALGLPLPDSSG